MRKGTILLSQLKLASLTDDQKGDILAELTGAICHLHVHTEDLPQLVEDEILALPEDDPEFITEPSGIG